MPPTIWLRLLLLTEELQPLKREQPVLQDIDQQLKRCQHIIQQLRDNAGKWRQQQPTALQQALTGRPTVSSTPLAEPGLLSTDQLQWEHIERALALHQGNISQTARSLGMHRRTLQRKLLKHRP